MKALSLKVKSNGHSTSLKSFLFKTPILTPATDVLELEKETKLKVRLGKRFIIFSLAFFTMYSFYQKLFSAYSFPWFLKSYLLAIFIYIFTSYICVLAQILCLPTGKVPVDMHNNPFISKNILELWSKRWNTWVRDWLSHLTAPIGNKSNYKAKIFWSFLFSGLFHEIMFQLPYAIYSGHWIIGPMIAYFMIQWAGVVLDHQIKSVASDTFRRFFMWIILIVPCPLFINPAFLYFVGL